ncbi:DUF736 domain-containing protein [Bradyrhizobium rifense]|uniref:DUF736 domain-containing protein n=1 Tax=Bradyrhizobium rifense TaxID=515499 RepID=A0A5D3K0L7_9BRAD|nr:DUF736 domain-containing protein [Bradyrhizobium rifense]
MIERGAPLHRSYVGQTEIGRACLKRSEEERCYFSLKLDDPSFNVARCAVLLDDCDEASSFVRGGCKNGLRDILHQPARLQRAGLHENGQARPCRAADANRTSASEGLAPSQRRHPDLREGKHHMIASDCRGDRECGCDRDAQGQGPTNGDDDLTSGKRQRARCNSDKQCAEDARAITKCQHSDADCDEKRQGIHSERKDRPTEQANAECVENKPKREHGGGSICIDMPVAPSTTTTAQFWM